MGNKILFLIKAPNAGGAETYLLRYMRHCKQSNYTVYCKGGIGGELELAYREVCTLKLDSKLGYYNPFEYIKFYKYLKRKKYTSVCDFQGNFSGFVLLCAKIAGVSNRIAFYRESKNKFSNSFFKRIYTWLTTRAMLYSATRILANSKNALNHFHPEWEGKPNKFRVIYNGFDSNIVSRKDKSEMRNLLNIPHDAFVIGHSGRYCSAKNHEMILHVALKLCSSYPNVIFVLMGRDVKEHLQNEVEKYDLSEQIRFLGYRTDVLDVLKSVDTFYFPSLTEGQPNALIEAMMSNVPFVASNIPSIKETVPDCCQSFLVDPNDFEENYKALEKAVQDLSYLDETKCSIWAKEKFNADKLFNEFREELELLCTTR